ncbi:DUF305 domain-containing protein [Rhodohalobacter sp.]|uniref:DUF305 domain-containing protein n=1 Tax=Rhodohalobacter sp. TaxID=1974210 RepID=UPI003563BC83
MLVMISNRFFIPFFSIAAILFFLFVGCSTTQQASEPATQQQTSQGQAIETQRQNHAEMEEIYWDRIEQSRMNFNQADIDFMVGMIGHHSQALIMSRLAPENGASRSVQVLASRIINAQSDEIAFMQRWLRDRGQSVPIVHIDGINMTIEMEQPESEGDHSEHGDHDMDSEMNHDMEHNMEHGSDMMHDHSGMPGMLTQQQLENLAAARGKEFDRLFLTYMIEHHNGAVIMVEELFAADGAASDTASFELASGINAEQVTEIERMKLMLENID